MNHKITESPSYLGPSSNFKYSRRQNPVVILAEASWEFVLSCRGRGCSFLKAEGTTQLSFGLKKNQVIPLYLNSQWGTAKKSDSHPRFWFHGPLNLKKERQKWFHTSGERLFPGMHCSAWLQLSPSNKTKEQNKGTKQPLSTEHQQKTTFFLFF